VTPLLQTFKESNQMMTMENETLREKLHNAEQSLSLHVKKCENLIIFFTNQIQTLTDDLEQEKSWRTNQLTKIVKALMTFESKLRNDQKLILNQLCAKDSEINKLASELVILNERCGLNRKINVNEAAQYCLSCRKQYYRSEMVNASTQSKRNQNGDSTSAVLRRHDGKEHHGNGRQRGKPSPEASSFFHPK
ncbi:hypothetical protein Bhyg_00562, partial [Pseudolycoriella hygida]